MARIEGVPAHRAGIMQRFAYWYARRRVGKVPEELFAALRAALDDAQIVELTATIAWENYRARFDHALEIGAQGFSEGAVCAVPERGTAPYKDAGEAAT